MTLRVLREWALLPPLYIEFIHCVYGYLAFEYLVLHLYNKSPVIEHQFTVCGLFDFAYFVCVGVPCCGVTFPQLLEGAKVPE